MNKVAHQTDIIRSIIKEYVVADDSGPTKTVSRIVHEIRHLFDVLYGEADECDYNPKKRSIRLLHNKGDCHHHQGRFGVTSL